MAYEEEDPRQPGVKGFRMDRPTMYDERPVARGTIPNALETQAMLLGELEKSIQVLIDHLQPILRDGDPKAMLGIDEDGVNPGSSTLHNELIHHNEKIQRLIRTVDRTNGEIDL